MEFTHKLPKLEIHFNPEGWGPINGEKIVKFGNVPYLHFDKKDKISRPADFVSQNASSSTSNYARSNYIRRRVAEDGLGGDYFARHEANEEKTFQLVDTTKGQQRHRHTGKTHLISSLHYVFHHNVYYSQASGGKASDEESRKEPAAGLSVASSQDENGNHAREI